MTDLEQEILEDVVRRTGLQLSHLQLIDTNDLNIARKVLPVLQEWVKKEIPPNYRHTIYILFLNKGGREFLNDILCWWVDEDYKLANEAITQSLHKLIRNDLEAAKALDSFIRKKPSDFDIYFLTKLHKYKSTQSGVEEILVDVIRSNKYQKYDIPNLRKLKWNSAAGKECASALEDRNKLPPKSFSDKFLTVPIKKGKAPQDPRTLTVVVREEIDIEEFPKYIKQKLEDLALTCEQDITSDLFIHFVLAVGKKKWILVPLHSKSHSQSDEEIWLQIGLADFDLVLYQIARVRGN